MRTDLYVMKVAIIKYNAGNVASVKNALDRLGVESKITKDADEIAVADRVIFPGVGEASSAMASLRMNGLHTVIKELKQPVLALCLGMHVLCETSEENDTPCIGVFPYKVRRFPNAGYKLPHMGWNNIQRLKSPLFKQVEEDARAYFVHEYMVELCTDTVAVTDYGIRFSSAIEKDNFVGVQFHPEKSGKVGAQILKNFLEM